MQRLPAEIKKKIFLYVGNPYVDNARISAQAMKITMGLNKKKIKFVSYRFKPFII